MHSYVRWIAPALFLAAAVPSMAASMCMAGTFDNIQGTTCDIGSLQFTFGSLSTSNESFDAATQTFVYDTPWTASDILFTPTLTGFTLGLVNFSDQAITAPLNGDAQDYIYVPFSVTALSGAIVATTASGGTPALSTVGDLGFSESYSVFIAGSTGTQFAYQYLQNNSGVIFDSGAVQVSTGPVTSASGYLYPFYLDVHDGGSASITNVDATFSFLLATPEPETYLLAGASLVALGLIGRKRRIKR